MDDERKVSPWIAWCSAVVVLLGLYVGAYSTLVEPRATIEMDFGSHTWSIEPQYRIGRIRFMRSLFAPANAIDRRLRPSIWNTP